jgi:hypothetical protein
MEPLVKEVPLTKTDIAMLRKLQARGWVQMIRLYGAIFLGIAIPGYFLYDFFRLRHITVYNLVALFFGGIAFGFLVRDYCRIIRPLHKEIKAGLKKCIQFECRKYEDPVFGQCLFYYPGKDNYFINITKEDFTATENGELLDMEVSVHLGEILLLKSSKRTYAYPFEFNFEES